MSVHTAESPIQVAIGTPQDTLPPAKKSGSHWQQIAEFAMGHPGKWCPVTLEGMEYRNLRNSTLRIQKGLLVAFRGDKWNAAVRDRVLWVRYEGERSPGESDWELISK